MRVNGPDGSAWWVELRGPGELNGGDHKALQAIDDKANGLENGVYIDGDGGEYEMSADGVSMVKRVPRTFLSRQSINESRDTMLARLITAWSLESVLPMPYRPGYLDHDEVPLELKEKVADVLDDVSDRLRGSGPKGTPETSSDSASTLPDESTAPLPGSAPTTAGPASGSPGTDA